MSTLVDTQAAAAAVNRAPATIRSWACRGYLTPYGTDSHGRTLYALADIYNADRARRPNPRRLPPQGTGTTNQQRTE